MEAFICATCGTRFAPSAAAPPACPICLDERQYIGAGGQRWTTMAALAGGHMNAWKRYEPGLIGIGTVPAFAIGQRALLLQSRSGNILWDCVSLLDDATIELVHALGGLRAIAISHPHYYSSMVPWARTFGAEIWLHQADAAHVMDPDPSVHFWTGERHALTDCVTLINTPSHFAGATMLHWAAGAGGQGVLLTGDIIQVIPDRSHVAFMRSYPNLIPLPAGVVERLGAAVATLDYTRIYGAWWDRVIPNGAQEIVARSVERYRHWVTEGTAL